MKPNLPFRSRRRGLRRAFSLIEAATATMIAAVAVVSMGAALAAGTTANSAGAESTNAVNLAGSVHELALGLSRGGADAPVIGPRRSVWNLKDVTFSPAVDGRGLPLPDYGDWEQQVAVQSVDNRNVASTIAEDRSSAMVRVTVRVYHHGRFVYSASWLVEAVNPREE